MSIAYYIGLFLFVAVPLVLAAYFAERYGYQRGFKKAVCQVPEAAKDLSMVLPYGAVYCLEASIPEGSEENRTWVVMISRLVRGIPCAAEVYRSTQELPQRFIVSDEGLLPYSPAANNGFHP
ncbi:MAG: hypothetical protein V4682_00950 [Patescibacteria group bacterium]